MGINSHIQIPHCILKYFQDSTDPQKRVWYLDITTNKIERMSARKLGTSNGYYSSKMEKLLEHEIETPLATLNSNVRRYFSGELESFSVSPEDENILKAYIRASAYRSNLSYKEFKENSLTAGLFSEQNNHDMFVYFSLCYDRGFDQLLQNYSMGFLLNRTDYGFTVPRNCFYTVPCMGDIYVAPISPVISLILISQKSTSVLAYEIENKEIIKEFNIHALKSEFMFNGEFIAAAHEEELLFLQSFIKENSTKLNSLSNS